MVKEGVRGLEQLDTKNVIVSKKFRTFFKDLLADVPDKAILPIKEVQHASTGSSSDSTPSPKTYMGKNTE